MTSSPVPLKPLSYKDINWVHTIILTATPLIALYGIITVQLTAWTLVWSVIYYFITGLGITAGYHRHWAHKSYSAILPLQVVLALAGGGAVQGSIKWWCRDHRAHHRYTDTEKDPYGPQRGILYSHIGWMLMKKDPKKLGPVEMGDLNKSLVVEYQDKYYALVALFMGFIFPTMVAGLCWGDWAGGYFFAAVARLVVVHHATFCVNSLAHWLGDISFDDRFTPRDHFVTAIVTLGEGYHNFHHEFPQDYRNATKYYQYDPTKWLIKVLSWLGLAYDLKTFAENEVRKGSYLMKEKALIQEKKGINWGVDLKELPTYTIEEVVSEVKNNGKKWVILDKIVLDVKDFVDEHPGGSLLLRSYYGRDITAAFNGESHDHHNAARNLTTQMRVGTIRS
jgi:stearoyl-CoA desaturase (delta-9 desaturase)